MSARVSKHRCDCFSPKSATFLYGLRRDAPSTERVLLERLLNILSRAAARRGNNPQRLWAENERPEWWPKVTDLSWKNPREHPKDNKDVLRKKIDVLEKELRKRYMMSKELEEELETHRGSKKIDLELKSDFETIITKASGLHFMLDKVSTKMGQSRIISDKMATYISETRSCIERIHRRIDIMFKEVQAREERKSDLWAMMGVSKDERTEMAEDLTTDSLSSALELPTSVFPDINEDYLSEILSPESTLSHSSTSLPTFTVTQSSQSSELSDSVIPQNIHSPLSPSQPTSKSYDQSRLCVPKSTFPSESFKPVRSFSARVSRGLPHPVSEEEDSEAVSVMDFRRGQHVSITIPTLTKRSRRQIADDLEEPGQTKTKSRRIRSSQNPQADVEDVVVIADNGVDDVLSLENAGVPSAASSSATPTTSVLLSDKNSGVTTERHSFVARHRRSPRSSSSSPAWGSSGPTSPTVTMFSSQQHPSSPSSYRDQSISSATMGSSSAAPWVKLSSPPTSLRTLTSLPEESGLPMDVTIDAEELENVEAILEDSRDKPTVSMYVPDMSSMDHLAHMTTALSFEDLSPSVTERVMIGDLPVPHTATLATSRTGQKKRPQFPATETGLEKQLRTPGPLAQKTSDICRGGKESNICNQGHA